MRKKYRRKHLWECGIPVEKFFRCRDINEELFPDEKLSVVILRCVTA
jgi:hypothetical protein